VTIESFAQELDTLALFAIDECEMERLQAQAAQLREYSEQCDRLNLLLEALKAYEALEGSSEAPSATLYSNGSGYLETMGGGRFFHFASPEEAIAYLRSAVDRR